MPFHHDRSGGKFAKGGFKGLTIRGEGLSGIRAKIAAIQVKIGILSFAFHALANCRFRNYGCGWWWCSDIQSAIAETSPPGPRA